MIPCGMYWRVGILKKLDEIRSMERSTIANDAIEKCIVFSNKNLYMYIHWNLWLRKKVILKQFQTYPLSIVYEFRSLMETRIYLLSRSFPRFTYENLGNSLKKCPSTRSKHFEFFLLVSVDRKAIYRDQGNWYLRRGKRKENYTANFYTGRSTRRRSRRPITRFCNFLPYRMAS